MPNSLDYRASLRVALGGADPERTKDLADRQKRTVNALMSRMYGAGPRCREITLLADEVGLGKTFVALGVA